MLVRLAITQTIFQAILQFSNLFISVYLFRYDRDIRVVAEYNMWMYASWALFFYIGFKLSGRNSRIGYRLLGLSCLAAMVLLMQGYGDARTLGICMGIAGGLFWPSYFSNYLPLGDQMQSSKIWARTSMLSSLITVFVPLVFGLLVASQGYGYGFVAVAALSVMMAGMSFMLPRQQAGEMKLSLRSFTHGGYMLLNGLQGAYYSFMLLAIGVLVFMNGASEAKVGGFATVYALITFGVTVAISYLIPERWTRRVMLIGAVLFLLAAAVFWTELPESIIVYNVLTAAAFPLYGTALMSHNLTYASRWFASRSEGLVVRELSLTVGRLLFYIPIWAFGWSLTDELLYTLILLLSAIPLCITAMIARMRAREVRSSNGEHREAVAST